MSFFLIFFLFLLVVVVVLFLFSSGNAGEQQQQRQQQQQSQNEMQIINGKMKKNRLMQVVKFDSFHVLTQVCLVEEIERHVPTGRFLYHRHQIRQDTRQLADGFSVLGRELLLQKADQGSVSAFLVQFVHLTCDRVMVVQGPCERLHFTHSDDVRVGDTQSGDTGSGRIGHGSHTGASRSDVFDQFDGVAPHVVGQAAHEFAQTQTVDVVSGKVARHKRVEEALADVLVDEAVNDIDMSIELAEAG